MLNNLGENAKIDRKASTPSSSSSDVSKTQTFLDKKIKTFLAVITFKLNFTYYSKEQLSYFCSSNVCWIAGKLEVEIVLFIVQWNDKFIQAIWWAPRPLPLDVSTERHYRNTTLSYCFVKKSSSIWWQFSILSKQKKVFLSPWLLSFPPIFGLEYF